MTMRKDSRTSVQRAIRVSIIHALSQVPIDAHVIPLIIVSKNKGKFPVTEYNMNTNCIQW